MKSLSELEISPAPWSLSDDLSNVQSLDGHCLCNADYSLVGLNNRRLIAAAPKLYDACVQAYHYMSDRQHPEMKMILLRAINAASTIEDKQ